MDFDLAPLNYHRRIRDFLKSQHVDVWNWFSSVEARSDYREAVELHLLKTTYRMEREAHEALYKITDEVCAILKIEVPVTLYQSQDVSLHSAALYFTPGHGHVVFVGPVLELLKEDELRALLGHELSHFKLWTEEDGEFLLSEQILTAMANEPRAEASHLNSARLYQLYTEIYADRGSLMVADALIAVSMLLKAHTGLKDADAESYMKQAEDIFSKEKVSTEGLTHPELFIRVRAIQGTITAGSIEADEIQIQKLIEGGMTLDELDLLDQQEMSERTEMFLKMHLSKKWLRTGAVLAHAGLFFADLSFDKEKYEFVKLDLEGADEKLRDYYTYLLLDFASVDPELGENGIAASFVTADKIGFGDRLEELSRKELKLLKRDVERIRKNAQSMVEKAEQEFQREYKVS